MPAGSRATRTHRHNIADAKARLSELVQRALAGDEVVIARDHRPLVRLVPVAPSDAPRVPGTGKGRLVRIAEDFDAPLPDFDPYR